MRKQKSSNVCWNELSNDFVIIDSRRGIPFEMAEVVFLFDTKERIYSNYKKYTSKKELRKRKERKRKEKGTHRICYRNYQSLKIC